MQQRTSINWFFHYFLAYACTFIVTLVQAQVIEVSSVGITVSDIDRSQKFFPDVLYFEHVSEVEVYGPEHDRLLGVFGVRMRIVTMRLGQELIELTEYLTPQGKPIPQDSRSNDLWFQHIAIVVSNMDKAYLHLRKHHVQHVSTAPQTLPEWNEAAAGIKAFYFRDPDGHNMEIIFYPPGKGNPKWQKEKIKLFLGIDHTAIAISNTHNSLKFYRDLLGLKVAGESMNYGQEQALLNNVFGARLQITGLQASGGGPGVEFLEYLSPNDGRPYPLNARPNDLIHWHITCVVQNLDGMIQSLRALDYRFISSDAVEITENALGFKRGILIRGPDGHAIRLIGD